LAVIHGTFHQDYTRACTTTELYPNCTGGGEWQISSSIS